MRIDWFPNSVLAIQSTRQLSLTQCLNLYTTSSLPLYRTKQVHGADICIVENYLSSKIPDNILGEADALICSTANCLIAVKTADCLPILIYNNSGQIAAIHAGRRSTEKKIIEIVLETMKVKESENNLFYIWLGPRICKACYQIDPIEDIHFDLIEENKKQIDRILNKSQYKINNCEYCTVCHNELFYSYRKNNQTLERQFSIIGMVKESGI